MKTLKRFVVALSIMMGVVVGLSPLYVVRCATEPTITITNPPTGEKEKINRLVNDINVKMHDEKIFADADSYMTVTTSGTNIINVSVNMTKYTKLSQENKQKVMQITLDEIHNSDVSRTNRNKLYNFVADTDESISSLVRQLSSDVTADFAGAYSSFKPFSGTLGWILGIVALGMFILLGLTIVVDIAYINLPMVQLMFGDSESKKKPKFVSVEAWSAVKESESKAGTEYKSPLTSYLKTKTGQFIAIFICLLYLVSGKIYEVLAIVIDYFRGFLV